MEVWKSIPNYEGYYEVSSYGNLRSRKSAMKVNISTSGYYKLGLRRKGEKQKQFEVHRLVAMAFLNHIPDGKKLVVDHIDANKLNNNIKNLQIITHRLNSSKDKKNKTSKYQGVYLHKSTNQFIARIHVNGSNKYLGRFDLEYEAHLAYQKALTEHLNK